MSTLLNDSVRQEKTFDIWSDPQDTEDKELDKAARRFQELLIRGGYLHSDSNNERPDAPSSHKRRKLRFQ